MTQKRHKLLHAAVLGALIIAIAGCAAPAPATTAPAAEATATTAAAAEATTEATTEATEAAAAPAEGAAAAPANLDELVAAAKAEGELTTIALPHDWCNYGEVIEGFKSQVWPHGQRTEPGCRLGRRTRGHQGQQGQQGPAGAGRHRRRLCLWPAGQGRRPDPALQGQHLGHHSGRGQGPGWLLVRRLLRRHVLHGQQGRRHRRCAADLGRPAEGRVRGFGRPLRRPAHLQPGDPGRAECQPRQWRHARRPQRRPRSSSPTSTARATLCP